MFFLATVQSVFITIGYVIAAFMLLMVMVIIHELGHYTAGRMLGFKINEFSVGFGPAIFKRVSKKTGTQFSLRPFPLGGYCDFEGEDEENPSKDAFCNQKPWKRIIVLFAGAFSNFLSAILVIIIFFTCYGQYLPQVADTYEGSAAHGILQKGDIIYEVNGKQVNFVVAEDFTNYLKNEGDTVEFTLYRGDKLVKATLTKSNYQFYNEQTKEWETKYGFGYASSLGQQKLNFGQAFCRAWGFSFYLVYQILASLIGLLTGAIGLNNAGGPVTVIQTITSQIAGGFGAVLYILVILSTNLAVMNLLPFPALDGSRIVFTVIEWIRRKPLNRKVENIIHTVGLILLFTIMIILDICHLL